MHCSCHVSSGNKGSFLGESPNAQPLRTGRHGKTSSFSFRRECHLAVPKEECKRMHSTFIHSSWKLREPCWFHLQEHCDQNTWEISWSSPGIKKKRWQKCLQNTKIKWMLNTIKTIRLPIYLIFSLPWMQFQHKPSLETSISATNSSSFYLLQFNATINWEIWWLSSSIGTRSSVNQHFNH